MSEWIIKKNNKAVQDIPVKDKEGTLISNLASASSITFQIKKLELGAALVSKTIGSGIEVDTPSTGYLRLTLLPADTNQDIGRYYMALEIIWAADNKYEVNLKVDNIETEILKIKQDIINV